MAASASLNPVTAKADASANPARAALPRIRDWMSTAAASSSGAASFTPSAYAACTSA
eukprot:CAMPEP_0185155680 /NCGR_PEP_ID=MMETSP1139-20130426/600_1 /TAXON_ID=298111 /ORGANISM="Pavlova sp., Strain CCMP459" /LENGTH=56 /DNA_ID=CAMNT_0027720597 /DNA_START=23 /DNA_END=190 /DNA_ORIENTATION=+